MDGRRQCTEERIYERKADAEGQKEKSNGKGREGEKEEIREIKWREGAEERMRVCLSAHTRKVRWARIMCVGVQKKNEEGEIACGCVCVWVCTSSRKRKRVAREKGCTGMCKEREEGDRVCVRVHAHTLETRKKEEGGERERERDRERDGLPV